MIHRRRYAGYNLRVSRRWTFDVSCLITGPGTYSIGYSPSGSEDTAGSTPLNLGNPTATVQPTTLACGGDVDIDIAD